MSILIKGMEIPKDRAVYIAIDNGEVFVKPLGALHWTHLDEHAIELPPHGRLIDADALAKKMRGIVFRGEEKDVLHHNVQAFLDAPTIIPKDKEDKDGT